MHGKRVVFDAAERVVLDGPFTETKELIAGFWIWQVKDMAEAKSAYEALGFTIEAEHDVPTEKVKTAFIAVGESHLELLEPTEPSSVIANFLEEMKAAGARLPDDTPRIGAGGCRVAFIHPKSAAGVLLELKQA